MFRHGLCAVAACSVLVNYHMFSRVSLNWNWYKPKLCTNKWVKISPEAHLKLILDVSQTLKLLQQNSPESKRTLTLLHSVSRLHPHPPWWEGYGWAEVHVMMAIRQRMKDYRKGQGEEPYPCQQSVPCCFLPPSNGITVWIHQGVNSLVRSEFLWWSNLPWKCPHRGALCQSTHFFNPVDSKN